jgi:glycosyltransferase involved in cell wall biosynthesis
MKPYVSIVIPTFNEVSNIAAVMSGIRRAMKGHSYEIIVVDKHSPDGTAKLAEKLGASVLYDDLGKGSALMKGIRGARGKIVISMDADLSNRPGELQLLIKGIESGYDLCLGSRFMAGGGTGDMPLHRMLCNRLFVALVNTLYGSHYTDMCYGYRSFARGAAQKLHLEETGFGIETEINIKAQKKHLRVLEVPSYEKPRVKGEAKLRSFKDGYVILGTIMRNLSAH